MSGNSTKRPHNFQDLAGRRYGHLIVMDCVGKNKQGRLVWSCLCDCGNICTASGSDLQKGHKRSCNCQKKNLFRATTQKKLPARRAAANAEKIDPVGRITLPGGRIGLIDPEDVSVVTNYTWHAQRSGRNYYVRASAERLFLHNLLMGTNPGFIVDHRNGNGLDNRRSNLRWATTSQNAANKFTPPHGRTGYFGITGGWVAQIQHKGKNIHIGIFDTKEEAARAYDRAAIELHGEFARLNFPESV